MQIYLKLLVIFSIIHYNIMKINMEKLIIQILKILFSNAFLITHNNLFKNNINILINNNK